MINKTRRNTLKTLAAITATAMVPAMGNAMTRTQSKTVQTLPGTNLQLSFSSRPTGQTLVLSNVSNTPVTLKHVSPGIVHANGHTYDINSVLKYQSVTVDADSSIELPIRPTAQGASEQPLPSGLTSSEAFTVSTTVNTTVGSTSVTTLRSYLA